MTAAVCCHFGGSAWPLGCTSPECLPCGGQRLEPVAPLLPLHLLWCAVVCCGPQVVGFVPTGWTYEMRKAAAAGGPYAFPVRTKAACCVWLIPYSEHSSFPELREYVGFLRPKQVGVVLVP